MTSSNVTWHAGQVTRPERVRAVRGPGATLWLTGLSGSGKSTLAAAVEQRLVADGRSAYRLDGDNLRTGLNGDLGFDRRDPAGERPPGRPRWPACSPTPAWWPSWP